MNLRRNILFWCFTLALAWWFVPAVVAADTTSGLTLWWQFEETSGTQIADSSGNGNNGTITGTGTWVSGRFGRAIKFTDTTSSGGSAGHQAQSITSITFNLPMTLSFWFRPDVRNVASGGEVIFVDNSPRSFYCLLNGHDQIGEGGVIVKADRNYTAGRWYHIIVVYDTTGTHLYKDGALADSVNGPVTGNPVPSTLSIGCQNCTVDDLRVYSRALNNTQVDALYRMNGPFSISGVVQDTGLIPQPTYVVATPHSGSLTNFGVILDGDGDRIELPHNASFSTLRTATVELWFKMLSFQGYRHLIYNGAGNQNERTWEMSVLPDGAIQMSSADANRLESTARSAAGLVQLNQWHHVAGVMERNAGTINVILDGVQVATTNASQMDAYANTLPVRVGDSGEPPASGQIFPFHGQLDEVRIWNRARTLQEIARDMRRRLAGDEPGLVAYMDFDFRNANDSSTSRHPFALIGNADFSETDVSSFDDRRYARLNGPGPFKMLNMPIFSYDIAAFKDLNGDGIANSHEPLSFYPANPLSVVQDTFGVNLSTQDSAVDSDADGIPDVWELNYGLNPNDSADSTAIANGHQLSYYQQFQLGLNPTRVDFDTDGVTDFDELFVFGTDPKVNPMTSGVRANQFYYDKNDRLVGSDFANGLLIVYQYDGNGNLVLQKSLSRAASTNGLPAIWKYLNGLSVTNGAGSGAFDDPDGDGWSNYQEWKAGSSPTDSASLPDLGLPGIKLGSFPWPFAPTNFVVATGQLDGVGADELVIGADGDPAGATNFLYLLSQSPIGWSTQRVDVGAFGITSLAVGRPTNREVPAIYAGLRSATSTGGVMEVRYFGGTWQTNIIAWSTNASAQVLGVRDQQDILATLATTNAPNGAVYGVDFTNDWRVQLFDTNLSHRGVATTANLVSTNWETLRLLDQGGIQVVRNYRFVSSFLPVPSGAYQRGDSYYFLTEAAMNWTGAQADARLYGGDLVTLEDSNEEAALALQFGDTFWIGLYRESNAPHDASSYRWISGSSSSYRNWGTAGAPNQPSGAANEYYVRKTPDNGPSRWYDEVDTLGGTRGLIEVPATNVPPQIVLMAEPVTSKTNNWYGQNLDIGFARQNYTNAYSVFYAFNDDKNGNDMVDAGDDFVLAEYLVNGTNWTTTTLSRQPISGRRSPAYGLVSLNYTNGGSEVFFTGEPDGRVFAWTATNASGPLYRQPFSGHHAGRAWHALAGVKTPELGEGLVGLRVDPVTPDTCDVIYWPPQSELWQPADVPQTAPLAAIVTPPASGNGIALVNMQQWDAEGNSAQPELQYSTNSGSAWTNATVIAIDSAATGFVSAPPTGAVHTLTWNAGQDLGASFTNTVLLRARTRDVTLTGNWSVPVNYLVEISAGNPLAVNDVTNTLEDMAVSIPVLANDTVATGTLTVTSVGTPGHGTAIINGDSTITYTPATNYFGTDGFTYTVSDGVGGTSMAAVTVNVAAVNDPPAAAPYAFQTQEDQTLSLGWGATKDQEGDTVTLLSAGPTTGAGGTTYASGDVITYVPPLNFNGTDIFEYVVVDNGKTAGINDSKRATNLVTVTVLAMNDPPVITIPAPQTVNEDTGLVLTNLMISDVDASNAPVRVSFTMTNGTLTLAATNGLTFETGTNSGSQFTFTGNLTDIGSALTNVTFLASSNLNGAGAIRIDADDQGNTGLGGQLTDTKVLVITVNPVNDLPIVTLLSPTNNTTFVSVDVITLDASALDVDGQIIAVDFYEGTNRLTTLNSPPYSFVWTNVPLLTNLTNYALYAKASDDQGGVGYSQTNWINVRPPGLFRINNTQKMASRFALVITGETGQKYSIETSTNLETWVPVTTVTNSTGSVSYEDDLTNNVDRKFYRAKLVR